MTDMIRCKSPRAVATLMLWTAGLLQPSLMALAPGYDGPLPSTDGREALSRLGYKLVVTMNPWSGVGPVVDVGGRFLPVESDGDVAALYSALTNCQYPDLEGETSEPFRRATDPDSEGGEDLADIVAEMEPPWLSLELNRLTRAVQGRRWTEVLDRLAELISVWGAVPADPGRSGERHGLAPMIKMLSGIREQLQAQGHMQQRHGIAQTVATVHAERLEQLSREAEKGDSAEAWEALIAEQERVSSIFALVYGEGVPEPAAAILGRMETLAAHARERQSELAPTSPSPATQPRPGKQADR